MKKKLSLCILFMCPVFLFSQNIQSVTPNSANAGQTLNVTITGNNTYFSAGSGTWVDFGFDQGSGTVNSMNVLSSTSVLVNITVPPNTYTGDYDVYTNDMYDGMLTLVNGFHVNGLTPPSLISVVPNNANAGQTLNVTITGANTHFNSGSTTWVDFEFDMGSSTVNSITPISNTSLLVNLTVAPNVYTGDYDVYTYNYMDGYLTLPDGIHVNGLPPPSLISVVPNNANAGQTLNVTITGANTHFNSGSSTWIDFEFDMGSSTVNSITPISNTSLLVNLTVAPNVYTGDYDVYTYNYMDGYLTLPDGIHINGLPPPFSLNPSSGSSGDTLDVTITGNNTHFSQGIGTYVDFEFNQGSGTSLILNMFIYNDTSMSVRFRIPPFTATGDYDVYMSNSIDGFLVLHNGFYVNYSGIAKINNYPSIEIYPNPTRDKLNFELLQGNSDQKNDILIYTMQGQLLLRRTTNNNKTTIDISGLAKGVYILKIACEEGILVRKFMKE